MASLWRRSKSRYWTACFTALDGRQLKRSTKTTSRTEALKLANEFERAARAKRTALQMRKVISDLHREITGEAIGSMSSTNFVAEWLARKKPEISDATFRFYDGQLRRFLAFLGPKADDEIATINRADVVSFRNLLAESLTGKRVNQTLKAVRTIFRAARRDGHLGEDPTEFIESVREREQSNRRPFTMAEVRAVMAVAGDEWKSLVHFGLYTGQRLSDLATLTWRQLDFDRDEIRLTTSKTGRRQILPDRPAPKITLESLQRPGDLSAPLHPHAFGHLERTGRVARLSNEFADVLKKAGLRRKSSKPLAGTGQRAKRNLNELSFHSLRHTATSIMKEAGILASVVQDFIGHDDKTMSRHYTHTGSEALRKAAEVLPTLELM